MFVFESVLGCYVWNLVSDVRQYGFLKCFGNGRQERDRAVRGPEVSVFVWFRNGYDISSFPNLRDDVLV